MTDYSSRHRNGRTYRVRVGEREVKLYQPREVPTREVSVRHKVTVADRLDLLAYEHYRDPHQYWRIADANPSSSPEELLEPGRTLLIPTSD